MATRFLRAIGACAGAAEFVGAAEFAARVCASTRIAKKTHVTRKSPIKLFVMVFICRFSYSRFPIRILFASDSCPAARQKLGSSGKDTKFNCACTRILATDGSKCQ